MKEIIEYCKGLLNSKEDYPFGPNPLVFKVEEKMFALINDDTTISLKCDPFIAVEYREAFEAVSSGYHLNKKHWNTIKLGLDVNDELLKVMILHSYECVTKKLNKEKRKKYEEFCSKARLAKE